MHYAFEGNTKKESVITCCAASYKCKCIVRCLFRNMLNISVKFAGMRSRYLFLRQTFRRRHVYCHLHSGKCSMYCCALSKCDRNKIIDH